MLIIGTMELHFTKATGTFACPHCEQERTYRRRSRRNFLTLYFVPLIPLESRGQFVECSTCRNAFSLEALEITVEQVQAQKRLRADEMIRRVLVVIVAADDDVSDSELDVVCRFAAQAGLPATTREHILHEATALRAADMDPIPYLRGAAVHLNAEDKERLVYHAFLASTAGGQLSAARQELLSQIPDAIGIPELRFREIIVRAAEERP
jgi:hypothetical protein